MNRPTYVRTVEEMLAAINTKQPDIMPTAGCFADICQRLLMVEALTNRLAELAGGPR